MHLENDPRGPASNLSHSQSSVSRRDFLHWTGLAAAGASFASWRTIAGPFGIGEASGSIPADKKLDPHWVKSLSERGRPTVYRGPELEKIGMPIGGLCAGQLYLGGDGRLWHWDIFNVPQPSNFSDTGGPNYARPPRPAAPIEQGFAIKITGHGSTEIRTLDSRGIDPWHIRFCGQYPIGYVDYRDPSLPVTVSLEAFSPFIPLNVPDSSLPATVMRFTVKNKGTKPLEIELAGWLENAVCFGNRWPGLGQRVNRSYREGDLTFVHATAEPLPAAQRSAYRPEITFETFENGYGDWKIEGTAFGSEPASGTLPNQSPVTGFTGKRLVNTFLKGDSTKGRLTSPAFQIERKFVGFLIGGGSHAGRTCMNLLVDGKSVRTALGNSDERLSWQEWDVSELEGQTARLEIVDQAAEGWGHINVDQIIFTDEPPSARTPLTKREDFGSMALGVLGETKQSFCRTQVSLTPAEAIFQFDGKASESEIRTSFARKLIGAVGRKLSLPPGAEGEVSFLITWFFPGLMRGSLGPLQDLEKLKRSYANRFDSAADVARNLAKDFERLATTTRLWNETWYDSSLPYWFLDRTFAPLSTLATNTCYQFTNGRFYAFEGVYCCQGTCQHVWNYAQSVARIFPDLERDLRARTDFGSAWHDNGAIDYRGECAQHVAHDGQCGVILRAWREHQMAPDNRFLQTAWPRIRKSLEYLMALEGGAEGLLTGEQYNTLDAAWFGPMAWISSFYIAALRAGEAMAKESDDKAFAERCRQIAERGSSQLVEKLYNGEFFIHKPDTNHPRATNTNDGCHIDQLMGQAWAWQVGLPRVVGTEQTLSALEAIWKYNFAPDVGPYRESSYIRGGRWYAMPGEGGVVMTTFPRGGIEKASGNGGFGYYFNEVWTGQEHQLAAHMLWEGMTDQALVITRVLHDRHHAMKRNPYNEVECSDHYSRAMASHGTYLAACGYEYHGPKGYLGFVPRIHPEHFKAAFTAAEGWGTFQQDLDGARQIHKLTLRYGRLRLKTLSLQVPDKLASALTQVRLNGTEVDATARYIDTRLFLVFREPTVIPTGGTLEVIVG